MKTRQSNNWTTTRLIKKPLKGPSALGKLYHHVIHFEDSVDVLHFISNASYSLGDLKDGTPSVNRTRIACAEISDSEVAKIRSALKAEYSLPSDPIFEGLLVLSRAELPLHSYPDHTLAKVTQLLDQHAAGSAIRPVAAYHALMSEIEHRAAFDANLVSEEDAYQRKSLSREQVTAMLDEMVRTAVADPWQNIAPAITSAGWSPVKVHRIGKAHRALTAKRTLPEWESIERAANTARAALQNMPEEGLLETLDRLSRVIVSEAALKFLENDEVLALALEVMYAV